MIDIMELTEKAHIAVKENPHLESQIFADARRHQKQILDSLSKKATGPGCKIK